MMMQSGMSARIWRTMSMRVPIIIDFSPHFDTLSSTEYNAKIMPM